MATSRIKVRFNLSAGKNYMKWKVEYPDRKPEYYDPKEVQLLLGGCTLKNHRKTAQKIYEGANKTVCAWVRCEKLFTRTQDFLRLDSYADITQLKYNPKRLPHWFVGPGMDVDGSEWGLIVTIDYKLFSDDLLPAKYRR